MWVQQRQERSRRRVEEGFRSQDLICQRMERRLQHSEDQMAMAIDAAKIGFFEWDCIGNKHMWSNRIRPLLGISPEAPANFEVLMAAVHPDDRQALQRSIAGVTTDNLEFTLEHRTCWPDGSVHWVWVKGRGYTDQNGRVVLVSGVVMDIDERKPAEERYRLPATALQEAANAVVLTDIKEPTCT